MEVKLISDADQWDSFVAGQRFSQFLQSWAWGEFQQSLGRPITRLGLFDHDVIASVAQAVEMRVPFGLHYLYVPRGPVSLDPTSSSRSCALQRRLIEIARARAAFALRVEPPAERPFHELPCFDLGYRRTNDFQPRVTRALDLTKSLDELRVSLHPKTRYNIGLAERKGVTIHDRTDEGGIQTFLELQAVTAVRDKIAPYPDAYFRAMCARLIPAGLLHIMTAEHEGNVLAANLMIQYGDTVTYNHGASADENRNLMAPHLLQWRAIEQAKADGFKVYDFRGIAPTDDPKHAWAGITRFKAGFGGRVVRFPGTLDLPIFPIVYWPYRIAQRALGLVR